MWCLIRPTRRFAWRLRGARVQSQYWHLQIKAIRPSNLTRKKLTKRHKSVNRIYGGCLDHKVVRER